MSVGNVGFRKLGFLSKNCKNQDQLFWRASQTKREENLEASSGLSDDRYLALDPSNP